MKTQTKRDLLKLAKSYACEIEICANGRIYLHAPNGHFFLSCDSVSIGFGGSNLPANPTSEDYNGAYHFFKSELNEGIDKDE